MSDSVLLTSPKIQRRVLFAGSQESCSKAVQRHLASLIQAIRPSFQASENISLQGRCLVRILIPLPLQYLLKPFQISNFLTISISFLNSEMIKFTTQNNKVGVLKWQTNWIQNKDLSLILNDQREHGTIYGVIFGNLHQYSNFRTFKTIWPGCFSSQTHFICKRTLWELNKFAPNLLQITFRV